MKKGLLAIAILASAFWLRGDNLITVLTPGPLQAGAEIHFRFDAEGGPGGEAGGNYNWSFGDGTGESTANRQVRHVFNAPGTYTVNCLKESFTAVPASASVAIVVVDNRRISPQGGGFRVGQRVLFQADNFVASSLRWDFGDGTVESGPRNHGHVYAAPGAYTVKAYDHNGDSPTFSSAPLTVEADNRRLSAAPEAPRANQRVAFSAHNFAGGGLRWDFGDGRVENGGPSASHVYRQGGGFQVRAWEAGADAGSAVSLQLVVAPDNRQLQANPAAPRAGAAVQFTAANFASASLRWNFGDGAVEPGGPAATHAYAVAGSVQVRVWEESEGPESAVQLSLAVQPDPRQLSIAGPGDVFEGSEVVFEGRNFASPSLEWDFGDGTVERAGSRRAHRFQRPGQYQLRVKEAEGGSLPLEKRVQVLADNRALAVKTGVVYAGSEFEIEARNFRGSQVSWDFGDGPPQSGPRLMKHRYARSGPFRVKAVDFAGRDGKTIETQLNVETDPRQLRLPAEVIAGERVLLELLNAPPGAYAWRFSDGEAGGGNERREKSFRTPGPHRVTVSDAAGKLPPLEATVQVVPDNRALKAAAGFALPREEVAFTAANFRGPGIRWDFGDGTVKESGGASERHAYAAVGRYRVKAVDFNGRGSREFSADVVVADISPGFELAAVEFAFDNGKYYRVMPRKAPAPGFQLRVKARGRGVLTGRFLLDNMSLGPFQLEVRENQAAVLPKAQMPALPVIDLGRHELVVKFDNVAVGRRLPAITYFVTDAGVIQVTSPAIDAKVPAAGRIALNWSIRHAQPRFEIAVSAVPFQFLEEKQVEWLPASEGTSHRFDPAPFKAGDWIYWQVRLLGQTRQVLTTSEIASFRLTE